MSVSQITPQLVAGIAIALRPENQADRAETETRLWGVTGDINLSIGAGVLIADCALVIGLRKTLQDAASKTSRM